MELHFENKQEKVLTVADLKPGDTFICTEYDGYRDKVFLVTEETNKFGVKSFVDLVSGEIRNWEGHQTVMLVEVKARVRTLKGN